MGGTAKVVAIVVAAGVLTACVFLAIWKYRRQASAVALTRTRSLESSMATLQANSSASLDSSISVSVVSESVSDWGHNLLPAGKQVAFWGWRGANNGRDQPLSVSGIPKYHYKDLQKATKNFTMILGHGSFGLVYKAVRATGEVIAEKVLATPLLLGARRTQGIGCRRRSPGGPLVMCSLGRVVCHSR